MQQARQLSLAGRAIAPPQQPFQSEALSPKPAQRARKIKLFLIIVSCFLLCLVVVAQYSQLVITNYRLSRTRAELGALQEQTGQLELEVAALSSVGRLEEVARTELNMAEPTPAQLRVITASRGLNGY